MESHSLKCRTQNKITHNSRGYGKGKEEASLTLIETDVPIGPPLATTRDPSANADPNELVFTPGA
jgi:hypothetical protein